METIDLHGLSEKAHLIIEILLANLKFNYFVSTWPVNMLSQEMSCPTEAWFSGCSRLFSPTQSS